MNSIVEYEKTLAAKAAKVFCPLIRQIIAILGYVR